jgi:hypothetical protein
VKLGRQRIRTLAALAGVWVLCASTDAGWEPTTPGDPNRNWSASLSMQEGYDSNVYTSSHNPQNSFSSSIEPQLNVNFPLERSSFGLRYTYRATWYTSLVGTPVNQSNIGDAFFSYMFTPRLALNISDSVRSGVNPEEVMSQDGSPVIVQQRGTYLYNVVHGSLSYSLSRRWIMTLNGSWDFWRYAEKVWSVPYNREDYSASLSAQYSIDTQTFLGGAYQFSTVQYQTKNFATANWSDNTWPGVNDPSIPASANLRDGNLNTVYLFLNRRLNPQWAAQLNGGYQWTVFGSGAYATRQSAPYLNFSTTYNYGPQSAVSGGLAYSINVAEVAQYRSTQTTSFYLKLDHQFTPRLTTSLYGTFNFGTYQNPLPGYPFSNQTSTSELVSFSLTYSFRRWLQLIANYTFDNVASDVSGSYTRNRINLGLRLYY